MDTQGGFVELLTVGLEAKGDTGLLSIDFS